MKKRLLQDLIKNRTYKTRENLHKHFLRFYYNSLFLKKIEESNDNNKQSNSNNNIKINRNEGEIRIEYKDRNKYTEEEIQKVKRNKELRDLFYNKIRERQNYLHKCFTRFYYKGLMLYMKNKNSPQNENNSSNTNPINNVNDVNKVNENNIINTNNNVTNTNSINIISEEKPEEVEKKKENKYEKSRGLRRLLNKKAKEKKELLRKYFFKFYKAGVLISMRQKAKRASLYKKMEGVDFETAMNTVVRSVSINGIEVDENSNVDDFQAALTKRREEKKCQKEKEEEARIEEEHVEKENEELLNELKKVKEKALQILFCKLDRNNQKILKKKFDVYYLKSKVLSLNQYVINKPRRTRTLKKKEKSKQSKRSSLHMKNGNQFINKILGDADIINENKNENENENDKKSENSFNIIIENENENDAK